MKIPTPPRLGFLYDPVVLDHRPPPGHPERPVRVSTAMQVLEQSGILARLQHLPVIPATRDQMERVHTSHYLDTVERIVAHGGGYLDARDTIASPGTWRAATAAAGASVGAVEAVMTGIVDAAFAMVRPPGHHATPTAPMGFCVLNNAAIAAAHAVAAYGLSRILLIDFDVHHGNGIQDAFYADSTVLYFSTHQSPAYPPGTGRVEDIGEGPGLGFTVNVPLPPYVGDDGFEQAFQEVLYPIADRYQPELVILSAGYDAHWRNSTYVAGIQERMTVTGLAALSAMVREIAEKHCPGRLVGILEGGYDLEALAYGVLATLRVWLGETEIEDPIGQPPDDAASPDITDLLERIRLRHGL
jgi:acetoin utilization deacetylase AcuC-like enzyme